jgi:hypothetical protein
MSKKVTRIITGGVEMVDATQLQEHPDNPRRGDLGAVVASIQHHGFWGTLIVQRSTGHVLAGNHRLKAARKLGIEHVPVQYVDCDVDQARAILLADNRTSDLGGYDNETLAALLGQLDASCGLEGTGYDAGDLEALLDGLAAPDEGEGYEDDEELDGNEALETSAREVDVDSFEMGCRCPRCGFEFNPPEAQ